MFQDRTEAAEILIPKLLKYQGSHPLVLGIPRGAIVMASHIATALNGELGLVLVHKISAPGNPELAIAAIGLSGHIQTLSLRDRLGVPNDYLENEAKRQWEILKRRKQQYGLPDLNYQDRTVIIVDDGIATGATVIAAIQEVKSQHPKSVIVAAGVAAKDSAKTIRKSVDELVLAEEPDNFYAVGQFYEDFPQVSDEEVISFLNQSKKNLTF